MQTKNILNMFNVNMHAHLFVSRAILPQLIKRAEQGKNCAIMDVTSNLGMVVNPASSVYGATKAFHISLSRAMHALYQHQGIDVLTLTPSAVRTKQNTSNVPVSIDSKQFASGSVNQLGRQKESYGHWWHAYYINVMPYIFPLNIYYRNQTNQAYQAFFERIKKEREEKEAQEASDKSKQSTEKKVEDEKKEEVVEPQKSTERERSFIMVKPDGTQRA